MDLKGAGRSPMAFVNKKSSVTTPTRKSFLQKLAEESPVMKVWAIWNQKKK